MQPAYPLYLLRHGQTEWNLVKRMQGVLNSPLTDRGVQQAHRMGDLLAAQIGSELQWNFVSSPLGRAIQTADIIAGKIGLTPTYDDRLREITLGFWDGLLLADIQKSNPEITSQPGWDFLSPDGETYQDVEARTRSWLQSVTAPTIAVSHRITISVIRDVYQGEVERDITPISQDGIYLLADNKIEFIACPV